MTEEDGAFTVGACLYNCYTLSLYYQLPCRVSELQNYTCPPWMKRGGPLCSKCIQGYGLPVYSYKLECVECDDNENNWLKYLAVAYCPLALFYVLVAMFSISFTSPTIIGLVMVCQVIATQSALELLGGIAGEYSKILGMYATFALFFNLDFGRIYYNFCLNPSTTAIQIQVMDYGIVVFPVVLILLTYFLVQLHDKNLRPVVWIWKVVTAIKDINFTHRCFCFIFIPLVFSSATHITVYSNASQSISPKARWINNKARCLY